jgi:hypothetical protein
MPACNESAKSAYLSFSARDDQALWRASRAGSARCNMGPWSDENACWALSACFTNSWDSNLPKMVSTYRKEIKEELDSVPLLLRKLMVINFLSLGTIFFITRHLVDKYINTLIEHKCPTIKNKEDSPLVVSLHGQAWHTLMTTALACQSTIAEHA